MLALIGVQTGTGLFANDLDDGGDTEGPLMHLVGKDQSDWLGHIHALNFKLIEWVIVLHVVAIVLYAVLKRQNLVRPMVTGTKLMPEDGGAADGQSGLGGCCIGGGGRDGGLLDTVVGRSLGRLQRCTMSNRPRHHFVHTGARCASAASRRRFGSPSQPRTRPTPPARQ